jgi:hypothetical protein
MIALEKLKFTTHSLVDIIINDHIKETPLLVLLAQKKLLKIGVSFNDFFR